MGLCSKLSIYTRNQLLYMYVCVYNRVCHSPGPIHIPITRRDVINAFPARATCGRTSSERRLVQSGERRKNEREKEVGGESAVQNTARPSKPVCVCVVIFRPGGPRHSLSRKVALKFLLAGNVQTMEG